MCRAVKVLCVAPDEQSLVALRKATVASEWELTTGATNETDALALVDAERPPAGGGGAGAPRAGGRGARRAPPPRPGGRVRRAGGS